MLSENKWRSDVRISVKIVAGWKLELHGDFSHGIISLLTVKGDLLCCHQSQAIKGQVAVT
jgi:hypothetical protein